MQRGLPRCRPCAGRHGAGVGPGPLTRRDGLRFATAGRPCDDRALVPAACQRLDGSRAAGRGGPLVGVGAGRRPGRLDALDDHVGRRPDVCRRSDPAAHVLAVRVRGMAPGKLARQPACLDDGRPPAFRVDPDVTGNPSSAVASETPRPSDRARRRSATPPTSTRRPGRAPSSARRLSASRRRGRRLLDRPPTARAPRAGVAAAARGNRCRAYLRDRQLDRAHPRVPRPHAIPVAMRRPLGRALVPVGADQPATSVSINACDSTRMPSRRTTSPSCSSSSLPTNADRSILGRPSSQHLRLVFSWQGELTERCAMAASPV